ncbi:hypothetical protein J2P12_02240 [Candidatus Bathyarchaeota archaeon]|nr:hypothetical protein [Candidatus Bathyarchaeota archaeon]
MRAKTPILALLLTLSVLMALPSIITVPKVFAVDQVGNTRWSPFGPQEQNLIIDVRGEFNAMFTAFTTGALDITDWPIQTANLGTGSAAAFCDNSFNPDYFCTSPTSELGIFDLQINSFVPVMGQTLVGASRTATASIVTGTNSTACDSSHDSFTITLQNAEPDTHGATNSVIKDQYNSLTVANFPSLSPSVTVSDAGGSTPTGTYNVPCQIAGTYQITSNIYGGSVLVKTRGGQNHAITVRLTYNSLSPSYTSANRYYWGAALGHLLDGPAFDCGDATHPGFFSVSTSCVATLNQCFAPGNIYCPREDPTNTLGGNAAQLLTNADCHLFGDTANPTLHSWSSTCASNSPLEQSRYTLVQTAIDNSLWWTSGGYGGPGVSSHADIRAACDNLVSMGLTLSAAAGAGGCENVANALSNSTLPAPWTQTNYPHVNAAGTISFIVRTSAARKAFGIIIADSLNAIFGTPNSNGGGTVCYSATPAEACKTAPTFYPISKAQQYIFADGPVADGGVGPNNWALYTGGFTLTSTPDALYGLFNSLFSGGTCGGLGESQPNDYVFFCNPQFDTDSNAGEFGTSSSFGPLFDRAALDGINNAMDVPVYTGIDRFVELNGWNFQQCGGSTCANTQSSIVNTIGAGTEGPFWTLLNARQVPGYSPHSSTNTPGGGNPNLIRYGFSQGTINLSPFQYTTVWEANVVFEVFDSMLAVNPLVFSSSGQLLDWQTTTHSASFNPTQVCTSPGTGQVTGCTTQVWKLRNDLKFQDGNPVTAADVAYSILAFRDVPSANLGPSVVNVASAVGAKVGSTETLTVVLAQNSPFYELDIGGLPILEKALWAPYCGDPPSSTSQCANLAFDPMTAANPLTPGVNGIFVGDGPFSCVVPTGFPNAGHVGGSCTESGANVLEGQAVDTGGRILLQRNSLYLRCCPGGSGATSSSLYKASYADKNNDGVTNIQDLASTAACFGLSAGQSNAICSSSDSTYWVNSNISPGSTVNINDLATVAFYFGSGTVSYGANSVLSTMTGIDPQIDPFFCASAGC